MQSKVEKLLGYEVDQEQYKKAVDYADMKTSFQDKLYGRANSMSEIYMAKVIAEVYETRFFKGFSNTLSTMEAVI